MTNNLSKVAAYKEPFPSLQTTLIGTIPISLMAVGTTPPRPSTSKEEVKNKVHFPNFSKSFIDVLKNKSTSVISPKPTANTLQSGFCRRPLQLKPATTFQGKPSVLFSKSDKERFITNLKFVLIGKFSHGRPTMRTVKMFFSNLNLQGEYNISVLDPKHLIIECQSFEDFVRIWVKMVWVVGGFTMRIFKWMENFHPSKESSVCPVWVHLPGLPLFLFNEQALYSIASAFGNPLKLDWNNLNRSKLGCASFCVEIDVAATVIDKIWINFVDEKSVEVRDGFWQKVVYDYMPTFCLRCVHLGHTLDGCKRMNGSCEEQLDVQHGGKHGSNDDSRSMVLMNHEKDHVLAELEHGLGGPRQYVLAQNCNQTGDTSCNPAGFVLDAGTVNAAATAADNDTFTDVLLGDFHAAIPVNTAAGVPFTSAAVSATAVKYATAGTIGTKLQLQDQALKAVNSGSGQITQQQVVKSAGLVQGQDVQRTDLHVAGLISGGQTTLETHQNADLLVAVEGLSKDSSGLKQVKGMLVRPFFEAATSFAVQTSMDEHSNRVQNMGALEVENAGVPRSDAGDSAVVETWSAESAGMDWSSVHCSTAEQATTNQGLNAVHVVQAEENVKQADGNVKGIEQLDSVDFMTPLKQRDPAAKVENEVRIISSSSLSDIEVLAQQEMEKIWTTTNTDAQISNTSPFNPYILDKVGSPVPCSEVIRTSPRLSKVRNYVDSVKNGNSIPALKDKEATMKDKKLYDTLRHKYNEEIRLTFEEHQQNIYATDYTTQKATTQNQEVIPDDAAVDKKEWTTVIRRSQRLNKIQGK